MEDIYNKTSMSFGVGRSISLSVKQEDEERTQLKLIFNKLDIKYARQQHQYLKKFVDSRDDLHLKGMGEGNWRKWLKGPNKDWPESKLLNMKVRISFRAFISTKSKELDMLF